VLDNPIAGGEFDAHFLERIGNIFEKNQAKNDVFVFPRVHVFAELIGSEPQLGLETETGRTI
jgi:hypothetical protein